MIERFRTPSEERLALRFGNQKINLHEWAAVPLEQVVNRLKEMRVAVLEGPVMKISVYNAREEDSQ